MRAGYHGTSTVRGPLSWQSKQNLHGREAWSRSRQLKMAAPLQLPVILLCQFPCPEKNRNALIAIIRCIQKVLDTNKLSDKPSRSGKWSPYWEITRYLPPPFTFQKRKQIIPEEKGGDPASVFRASLWEAIQTLALYREQDCSWLTRRLTAAQLRSSSPFVSGSYLLFGASFSRILRTLTWRANWSHYARLSCERTLSH